MTLLLVALGGALGAPLRYLVDRAVRARHDSMFPWGTLTVNVTGSLVLGPVAGADSAVSSVVTSLSAGLGAAFLGLTISTAVTA